MRRTYRVAIIGCGKVGVLYEGEPRRPKPASHAGAVRAHAATDLVAFVDTSPSALRKAQKLFPGVTAYQSVAECLIQERPDIVIIATPPHARLEIVRLCIDSGVKALICEKPLAPSTREARAIARAVSKSHLPFVLNYPRRFSPLFARVRKEIDTGALGRIQKVVCYYGNGLYNNGGHMMDTLGYLLDDTFSVLWAEHNRQAMHPKGDPCIDAALETKKGVKIVLQSLDQNEYGIFDIAIFGTKGERLFTDYGATLVETRARASRFKEVRQLDRAHARISHAGEGQALEEALRVLAKGEPARGAEQGLAVMQILDDIRHAAKIK
ncbi:hypothetical protein COU19_00455 [Candidatus Kaiserbacteria bacterium CG10_big_fil_rev_8_21_14_0_10_56_12]|uniref:Gfo/Idh/MocA-like oxidoreductase N-terminal domain-containing protein n=1 Tax=Candidatus Kaiserbacteria bacterium CG10_big_fil_rev_8_21_14_0_10_56_12 TaxID=1974611 RepID=A0A2H0UAH8_9BACT|nr:MAG: hypothetical protein COU19_00455 [Candidatus Kaiserbacteria bacterium CG10_big_fil_rev_8_21_14_0_10_56_12]